MASDKASPKDQARGATAGDAQSSGSGDISEDVSRVSQDLDRIASYLHDSRSATSEWASDLAVEISQRRAEIAGRFSAGSVFANRLGQIARDLPEPRRIKASERSVLETNRLLAERFHVFCCDMDELLESFRSRVAHSRRVKH